MAIYNEIAGLLKETKHYAERREDIKYHFRFYGVDFTPRRIIGIIVHSMLSSVPRERYYANLNKIYFLKDRKPEKELTKEQKEDLVREHEIFQVLSYMPDDVKMTYGLTDKEKRLRIVNFDNCFTEILSEDYLRFLTDISRDVSTKIICDEAERMKNRIIGKRDEIVKLFKAMRKENRRKSPFPEFADKLEKKLAEYL